MQKDVLLRRSLEFLSGKIPASEHVPELQDLVRSHNELYYLQSDPVLDDREYDRLFKLLKDTEERLGIFDPDSPTKRIDVLLSRQFSK